ncbi:ABC transporter permease [Kribbella italica]|uniref:Putative ABC transport system permease protein n=1 Tax=Kribbella italica TaxID=1540520 RepID=A0A7W9MT95_9ACTN|nr:FtsX-like permease family protein [Kribbella italica]MBB5834977.1 putative ABC transport system permease protein [Kribbella italica]
MLKLGLRSVLAHRLRFVLCTVAVLLGIGFVSGAMVFSDTLSAALKKNFAGATADLTVTPASPLSAGTPTLSIEIADRIAAVPGVAAADAQLLVPDVEILAKDGQPIDTYSLATFGTSWPHDERTAPFKLLQGTQPWGTEQLTLDRNTADREGFEVGQKVKVVTPARAVTATLTGLTTPGLSGTSAGAPLVAFDSATAQLLLLGKPGWTSIGVALQPGQNPDAVSSTIRTTIGDTVEVRTAAEVTADGESALDDTFGGLTAALLLFAGLALFVSTFLIVNTFAMVVAQRSRELALLRAVGASGGQVTGTVLAEALVIGVIGSTLGLLLGVGGAGAIQYLYQRLDLAIPSAALQVSPATIIASYLLGVGITTAAAYPAARRAGKLSPVVALRADPTIPERSLVVRVVIGGFLLLMAVLLLLISLTADGLPGAVLVGLTTALVLLGLVMTLPLISRYAVRGLMLPLGRRAAVVLGRRNAERNPRRTAATASALMISLALVSGLFVIASSAKASVDQGIADAIGTSELVVTSDRPFSTAVGDQLATVQGISGVHRVRQSAGEVDDRPVTVAGVSDGTLDGPITATATAGSLESLAQGQVVLPRNLANQLELAVGETFTLTTSTGKHQLTVGAVIAPNHQVDAVLTSLPKFTELGGGEIDATLYLEVADGTDPATVGPAVARAIQDYPSVAVRDQQAYAAAERAPINGILGIVGALLGFAVLIALLGVVNTLALGVVERTRELGLLRAIGMDRPQVRRMLQVEAVAIALFGAVLGLLVGGFAGAAVQHVMADDGLGVLDVPVLQLVAAVVVAAVVGVLAAIWPSRRAARLDVLQAIATE